MEEAVDLDYDGLGRDTWPNPAAVQKIPFSEDPTLSMVCAFDNNAASLYRIRVHPYRLYTDFNWDPPEV